MDASTFNFAINSLKTTISIAVGVKYGPMEKEYVDITLGHLAVETQFAAMGEKEQGTLTGDNYATLIKIVADIGDREFAGEVGNHMERIRINSINI